MMCSDPHLLPQGHQISKLQWLTALSNGNWLVIHVSTKNYPKYDFLMHLTLHENVPPQAILNLLVEFATLAFVYIGSWDLSPTFWVILLLLLPIWCEHKIVCHFVAQTQPLKVCSVQRKNLHNGSFNFKIFTNVYFCSGWKDCELTLNTWDGSIVETATPWP